jgi:hypothetical protein
MVKPDVSLFDRAQGIAKGAIRETIDVAGFSHCLAPYS